MALQAPVSTCSTGAGWSADGPTHHGVLDPFSRDPEPVGAAPRGENDLEGLLARRGLGSSVRAALPARRRDRRLDPVRAEGAGDRPRELLRRAATSRSGNQTNGRGRRRRLRTAEVWRNRRPERRRELREAVRLGEQLGGGARHGPLGHDRGPRESGRLRQRGARASGARATARGGSHPRLARSLHRPRRRPGAVPRGGDRSRVARDRHTELAPRAAAQLERTRARAR